MRSYRQKDVRPFRTGRQEVIRTTLYELVETVNDVAGHNGNEMVTAILVQLLENCRSNVVLLKTEEELGCYA